MLSIRINDSSKPDLLCLGYSWIQNRIPSFEETHDGMSKSEFSALMRRLYGGEGYLFDDDEDDEEVIYGVCTNYPSGGSGREKRRREKRLRREERRKERNKRPRGGRGKKGCPVIDINTPYSLVGDDGYVDFTEVEDELPKHQVDDIEMVRYYPNYWDRSEYEEFDSLKEFELWMMGKGLIICNGIDMSRIDGYVVHCCKMPNENESDMVNIIYEDSYGAMYYSALEVAQ